MTDFLALARQIIDHLKGYFCGEVTRQIDEQWLAGFLRNLIGEEEA